MHKKVLIATLISTILLLSTFSMIAFAPQPPVLKNQFLVGTIGQPNRLDPADAYDTASAEVLMNVYDTLIDYDRDYTKDPVEQGLLGEFVPGIASALPTKETVYLDIINLTAVNPSDPTCSLWIDGFGHFYHINNWKDNNPDGMLGFCDVIFVEEVFEPTIYEPPYEWKPCTKFTWHVILKEANIHIIARRTIYYFPIRLDMKIHDWQENEAPFGTGAWHINETLTTEDVEYSFERGLIQDRLYGPMWMLYKPLFDDMNGDWWFAKGDAGKIELAKLIMCAIQRNETHVWISVGIDFPEIAWYQILSETWSSIVPKKWAIDRGCWNGTMFNAEGVPIGLGWRRWPNISRSPLSLSPTVVSPYDATAWSHAHESNPTRPSPRGTGPYVFNYWLTATKEWRADKYPYYWGGWAPQTGHPYYVDTVIVTGVADWPTRKMMFTKGDFDVCAVPRANMRELLVPPDYTKALPGIVTIPDIPTLSSDSLHYQFIVLGTTYQPLIGGTNQSDFFSNINARKAFSYCLNFTQLLDEAWFNEAEQSVTWHIGNLVPDFREPQLIPYDIDVDKVEAYLKAAEYRDPPESLWDSGFFMYLVYNEGNDQRRIVCEMIEGVIESFNAVRDGPDFVIDVIAIDWDSYLNAMYAGELPCWEIGWLADFADADNWARPYMHTYGDFSYMQGYSNSEADVLIDLAVKTPDVDPTTTLVIDNTTAVNKNSPKCTYWTDGVNTYHLNGWIDGWIGDKDGTLSVCDAIRLNNTVTGVQEWWHVTEIVGDPTLHLERTRRTDMYVRLQEIWLEDCPTLMIVQPWGRAWHRNWVQGWYYNALFPGIPFYDRWKGFKEDFNRDMKVNLSDLVKLAIKFGTTVPPEDPMYDLNGDGKINLSDLIKCAMMFGAGVP